MVSFFTDKPQQLKIISNESVSFGNNIGEVGEVQNVTSTSNTSVNNLELNIPLQSVKAVPETKADLVDGELLAQREAITSLSTEKNSVDSFTRPLHSELHEHIAHSAENKNQNVELGSTSYASEHLPFTEPTVVSHVETPTQSSLNKEAQKMNSNQLNQGT
jgi:hypothetical protein